MMKQPRKEPCGMKLLDRITGGDTHGIHYAVSIFIATAVLWFIVRRLMTENPVWAISSMVATSEPGIKQAATFFRARIINTLVGCIVGLAAIAIGGDRLIFLPLAMAVTVLLSSYVVRVKTMWRQAPISAAFVISAGMAHHTRIDGLYAGAGRMGEVFLGCFVGIAVAWLLSWVWPLPESDTEARSETAAKD
jgi:uncharacterized membrane protein YccC